MAHYDTARFDELALLTEKLHDMGKKVMLYEACGRVPAGAAEKFAMEEHYVLGNAETGKRALPETDTYNPADHPVKKSARFVDITNPDALDWWQGTVWGTLVQEIGIDGAKIDFCEQFPEHVPVTFDDGRSSSGAHHWYPTLYNAMMYKHFNTRPDGGMCLSRGGGIGAQRYPFLWAGDQLREYSFLKAILTGVLSSGLSGIPFIWHNGAWCQGLPKITEQTTSLIVIDDGAGNVTLQGNVSSSDDGEGNVTLVGVVVTENKDGNITIEGGLL